MNDARQNNNANWGRANDSESNNSNPDNCNDANNKNNNSKSNNVSSSGSNDTCCRSSHAQANSIGNGNNRRNQQGGRRNINNWGQEKSNRQVQQQRQIVRYQQRLSLEKFQQQARMYDRVRKNFEDKLQTSNKDLVQYVNNEWNHSQKGTIWWRVQATVTTIIVRECVAEAAVKSITRLEQEGNTEICPGKSLMTQSGSS